MQIVGKLFETRYGYFTEDGDEYVIKTPRTPRPWINVISNGEYGLTMSQTGGGFSWLTHSEFNRITRWHQDLIRDNWGKYLYLLDEETGEFWNPGWLPSRREPDFYECRHGFGYSRFITECNGIRSEVTVFVPMEDPLELWSISLENLTDRPREIAIYSYLEWCLGAAADHHREFHKYFLETEYHPDVQGILAKKRLWEISRGERGHWNTAYPFTGFHTVSKSPGEYTGEKTSFLGQYGDLSSPKALQESQSLGGMVGKWSDAIGSLKVRVRLEPNSFDRLHFTLGLGRDAEEVRAILSRYESAEQLDHALNQVREYWHSQFDALLIDTPEKEMDLLVNKWLKYQAISGRIHGRAAYYQQSGAFGFRDQLQDSQIFLPINPKKTRDQICLHARHQLEKGTVLHWWHPITEEGLETEMTDDLLWLPFLVLSYLDETADQSILEQTAPYYDNQEHPESIYWHCTRAIDLALNRFSPRGLPLIGAGDWNDGLSGVGLDMQGESVWLGHFLYLILRRFSRVAANQGDSERSGRYAHQAENLQGAIEEYGWDGEWFLRATKDTGEPVGSAQNTGGRCYLNAQTWAVISNVASAERQRTAMKAVERELLNEAGPLLLYPGYESPDEYIGYLSRYAPGTRENGGVYTHAATWAIQAFAMLKHPEKAHEIFQCISPVSNGMNPDRYAAEPYVTPGNIDGPQSGYHGRGGWTWYTGSAAWLQKVIVDWILGIRATGEGLVIDPCIPPEWDEFTIKRRFRGAEYSIHVSNPERISSGISSITLDGEPMESPIPSPPNGGKFIVDVVMGAKD